MTGANIYNDLTYTTLSKVHEVKVIEAVNYKGRARTYLQFFVTYLKSLFASSNALHIIDFEASCWVSGFMPGKKIIIMHHFDVAETGKRKKKKYLWNRFLTIAKKSEKIVVVAKFWKDFLQKFGIKNVEVIYNSFNEEKYDDEIPKKTFYEKYNLPSKPIIYLGKNSINKTLANYKELAFLEDRYLLVTSGKEKSFNGPIHLDLSFKDYISLLTHSELAVLFTPFKEGWNRIAHEALLCNTPVIGSSFGGLGELLALTNQEMIDSIDKLKKTVLKNLKSSSREVDRSFIQKLNVDYFFQKWNNLIDKIEA